MHGLKVLGDRERDPAAVWRPGRRHLVLRADGELCLPRSVGTRQPQIEGADSVAELSRGPSGARGRAEAVHIVAGTPGLILGANMFVPKRRGTHTRIGELYHWNYVVMAGTACVMASLAWAESWFFVPIAVFSYAFALTGYVAAKWRPRGWLIPHVIGQCGSYIAAVSAFVTVNWERFGGDADSILPFFLPSVIGFPIVGWLVIQVMRGNRPRPA